MLSNGVYDLLVGSDGLLYIATFNGFSIYDGQTVTSYNFKDGLEKYMMPPSIKFEESYQTFCGT